MLLRVKSAHLLHEVLQDRLLAVLRPIYLYCGYEGDGGTQTPCLLSRLLMKLQSLAGSGAVLNSVKILNTETKNVVFIYLSQNRCIL